MKLMTQQNMINAFGGESQAYMRYQYFAVQAEKEGYQNLKRLYLAIAYAETIHAFDHYKVVSHLNEGIVANSMAAFGPGDSKKNINLAIAGESFEIEEMYPAYIEVAKYQGETQAVRSFEWSYGTEKKHKELFEKAKSYVDKDKDVELAAVHVCETCGYTVEGDAPDECPLCKAKKEKFRQFI